jgi:L-threonylcarbamoyladenylate synthase
MEILSATTETIRKAATILIDGGVVVYPTDTVYGLGCVPKIPEAAKRICFIKGRADKPLPIASSDTDAAKQLVKFNPAAERLAERFWPGPLMIVLPSRVEYSKWITHGAKTLGVRVPNHSVARQLAQLIGGAIVSTSANRSGKEPPRTAKRVAETIGTEVDLIIDAGETAGGKPSTVVDLSRENVWILRKGPITGDQIFEVISAN